MERIPLRVAWMASHGLWVAALAVSVNVGRRAVEADPMLAELCDAMFSNGNNGPFGYGANPGPERMIEVLLLAGIAAAIVLAIYSNRKRAHDLMMANLVIGVVGGASAAWAFVDQSERHPFCPEGWWRLPVIGTAVLLVAALVANVVLDRKADQPRTSESVSATAE